MKIVYIQLPTTAQEQPLLYIKPDTAVHNRELPLYIPDFTADLRAQVVLMAKLSKQGKCILEKFAPKYYEQVSLGLALTAYDRQQQLQATAKPWELATSFDSSMVVGHFLPTERLQQEDTAILSQDGQVLEQLPLQSALQLLPLALRTVSEYMTLRTGDLVALPLTNTLYAIRADTTWQASVQTDLLFSVTVKSTEVSPQVRPLFL